MEIDPISGIGSATLPVVLPVANGIPALPTETPLEHLRIEESETLEERAYNGDVLAVDQLAAEETRSMPVKAQHLLPSDTQHAAAHEPGKGDIIDVYD